MAHTKETREALRRAYVFSTLSLKLAAIQCGVSFATAGRWKKEAKENGDDWDVIRSANMLASGVPEDVARSILASLMTQFQVTLEKVNTADDIPAQERVTLLASLTDGYSKAIAASKKILPDTSQLATSMETIEAVFQLHPGTLPSAFDGVRRGAGSLRASIGEKLWLIN